MARPVDYRGPPAAELEMPYSNCCMQHQNLHQLEGVPHPRVCHSCAVDDDHTR